MEKNITKKDLKKYLRKKSFAGSSNMPAPNRKMCRYICNISTASYTDVSSTLAVEIESVVSEKFKSMIIQAKERGEISPNVDAPFAAFWLDGFITKLLLSYSTVYYREEMKIYLGDRAFQDDYLIDRIITAVRRSLGTPHRWEEE